MTIGTVAGLLGVSVQSLRLWERIGLIPRVGRSIVNRRTYTEQDVSAIKDALARRHTDKQV